MNYYERHLGDYARDTAHLTMLEHGAYGLLLDRYYATEQGIPADQAHRVARARSRDEKAAVDAVLAEFFELSEGVWTKGRVEREIEKATVKISAARENGKRGGRPRKAEPTNEEPTGFSLGSVSETQEKALQTPDTRHQIPPKPPSGVERRFEALWAEYPKKIGKDAAFKAFAKRKPDDALLEVMVEAVVHQRQSAAWQKDGGQFIPHPSTWLNQGRWQDQGADGDGAQFGLMAGAI